MFGATGLHGRCGPRAGNVDADADNKRDRARLAPCCPGLFFRTARDTSAIGGANSRWSEGDGVEGSLRSPDRPRRDRTRLRKSGVPKRGREFRKDGQSPGRRRGVVRLDLLDRQRGVGAHRQRLDASRQCRRCRTRVHRAYGWTGENFWHRQETTSRRRRRQGLHPP